MNKLLTRLNDRGIGILMNNMIAADEKKPIDGSLPLLNDMCREFGTTYVAMCMIEHGNSDDMS